jgi:hypothetical protein
VASAGDLRPGAQSTDRASAPHEKNGRIRNGSGRMNWNPEGES